MLGIPERSAKCRERTRASVPRLGITCGANPAERIASHIWNRVRPSDCGYARPGIKYLVACSVSSEGVGPRLPSLLATFCRALHIAVVAQALTPTSCCWKARPVIRNLRPIRCTSYSLSVSKVEGGVGSGGLTTVLPIGTDG